MGLSAASRLGPYEILAPLGAGGMGEVYRARDTRLGRDVAVKVLPAGFAADPERLRRFEQEARAASQLDHPNILVVHDIGTHEASPYIVSELLEGESLRDRLRTGDLTVRKAVEFAVQIAQGLAAAHEKGIVHRDLKPGNVFITRDGQVKILDFGLAKLSRLGTAVTPDATTLDREPRTESGAVLGTMGYTSPEQLRGDKADARSDIFSFGCVLYEMLAGKSPFLKPTGAETVTAIMSEDPPSLSETGRVIGPALSEIVSRCLEKRPEDRFSSAHDLALALRAYSGGSETPATVPVRQRARRLPRRWLVAGAGIGLLAVAAGLFVRAPWKRSTPAPSFDPNSVVVAAFENRTGDASLDGVGRQIADTLTDDLLKTGELKVAEKPDAAGRRGEVGGDPLLQLARATRSALVVAGAYDLRGEQIEVQARVVDPWQGKVVYTAAPVRCPHADPLDALEPLRQRVTGAVAWIFDKKLYPFFGQGRPTRYDALLEYRLGRADFNRDWVLARRHFEKALALDPEFDLARLNVSWVLLNQRRFEESDKELVAVEANLGRMLPVERLLVRVCRANLDGRPLEALAALREWAALSGFPPSGRLDIAQAELAVNHPAEAIRTLSVLPADWKFPEYAIDYFPLNLLAVAYHMNRDYEGQLRVAREGQRRFPGVLAFYGNEAGALAALGRLDEVEKAIAACLAQGGSRGGTPGGVMFTAAVELRAHGHRDTSLRMTERAVAWYQARPAAEAAKYQTGFMHMQALCLSEQWAEAKAMADALLAKNPEDVGMRGWVGMLAARLGDSAQARRIEAELAAVTRSYSHGGDVFNRACIAAQLGEKDRALALLREAFAQGHEFDIEIHRDTDLEPLWGYPPFEELIKPKG